MFAEFNLFINLMFDNKIFLFQFNCEDVSKFFGIFNLFSNCFNLYSSRLFNKSDDKIYNDNNKVK